MKAGRQSQCSFETQGGQPAGHSASFGAATQASPNDTDRANALQARVKHLESLIHRSGMAIDIENDSISQMAISDAVVAEANPEEQALNEHHNLTTHIDPSDHPSRRAPSGYYGRHSIFKFFKEVCQTVQYSQVKSEPD